MSGLSPEALASLGGLNLQDVKADLRFSPAEKKKPLTVELDWLEKTSIQFWNFDNVLEKLDALGTKTAPRENVVLPKAEESFKDFWERRQQVRQESPLLPEREKEDVSDWLTPVTPEEEAPRAPIWQEEPEREEPRQEEEPTDPRQAWNELPEDQRERDLMRWKLKEYLNEPLEDWQKEVIGGGSREEPLEEGEATASREPDEPDEAEVGSLPFPKKEKLISVEGMKVAVKSYLSSWFDKNRVQIFANLGGGAAVGFLANMCFTELIAQNRQMASFLPSLINDLQSSSIVTTNASEFVVGAILTGRGKRELFEKHLKAASLAEQLAIARSADNLIDRVLIDGLAATKFMRSIALHPGTMGFVSGAWLYAALSGAGVFGESGLTQQAHAVSPADSGGAGGAAEGGAGHGQTGGHFGGAGADDMADSGRHFGGLSPDERNETIVQPPVGGGTDTGPQFPTQDSPLAPVDPKDLEQLPNLTDSAEAAKQAAAEAARIAALSQGQTVLEIATTMPQQTVSEAILKIIGDIPHGGEITNVIYRAAGEDVGKLHEGAIRELANTLSDLFSKADTAANNFGVPYDKGVLNAVNNTQSLGPNSAVANIIRAGNLGDMEAAAKIREEVFRPILGALAK